MRTLEKRITALETAENVDYMVVILLPKETPAQARERLIIPLSRRGVVFVPNELGDI